MAGVTASLGRTRRLLNSPVCPRCRVFMVPIVELGRGIQFFVGRPIVCASVGRNRHRPTVRFHLIELLHLFQQFPASNQILLPNVRAFDRAHVVPIFRGPNIQHRRRQLRPRLVPSLRSPFFIPIPP